MVWVGPCVAGPAAALALVGTASPAISVQRVQRSHALAHRRRGCAFQDRVGAKGVEDEIGMGQESGAAACRCDDRTGA